MSDYEIKKLQNRVTNGGMDRREFLKAASALGLTALAPALYSQAAHATPKKGGGQFDRQTCFSRWLLEQHPDESALECELLDRPQSITGAWKADKWIRFGE